MARILLMEDDKTEGDLIQQLLTEEGHAVAHFRNATTALKHLQKSDVDLVITDIVVKQDGRSTSDGGLILIGRIRGFSDQTKRALPILAVSGAIYGRGTGHLLDVAKTVGADDALPKPIIVSKLLEKVSTLLGSA